MEKEISAVTSEFTICVASTNPVKVAAAEEGFRKEPWAQLVGENLTFERVSVDSNVSEVPTSIEEGINGVENRLKAAAQQSSTSDIFFAVEGIVVIREGHLPFVVPVIGVLFSERNEISIAFGSAVTIPNPYAENLLQSKFRTSRNREDLLEVFRADQNFNENEQRIVGLNGLFTNNDYCRRRFIIEALEYLGLQALAADNIEKPFGSIKPFETTDFDLDIPWKNVLGSPRNDKANNRHYVLKAITGKPQPSSSLAVV